MNSNRVRAAWLGLCLATLPGCDADFRWESWGSKADQPPSSPPLDPPVAADPPALAPSPRSSLSAPVSPPHGAPNTFADLAQTVDPSVVFVRTVQSQRIGFRRVLADGNGSGFIFDAAGLILTNYHVVQGAQAIVVELNDGRAFPAQVVGADPLTDVAVLRVQAAGLLVLELGDSDEVRVGDWVLAIGNPFGLAHTVSAGIISAKERTGQDVDLQNPRAYYSFLQTDASINPGNSGGPLIDLQGRVIGINTAINKDANSIGFAIPVNMVRELLPRLLKDGVIERAAIGVEVAEPPVTQSATGRGPRASGAFVAGVVRGGPADRAGLKPGDIVIELGGHKIDRPERLRWWASLQKIGQKVPLIVLRNQEQITLQVVPAPLQY